MPDTHSPEADVSPAPNDPHTDCHRCAADGGPTSTALTAERKAAERARLEQAKAILMRVKGCTEQEAYDVLRLQAMNRQQRLVHVAERIIATDLLLGP